MSQVQGGYAVVDVDDDSGSGQQGGLEFKSEHAPLVVLTDS
jgi:hypothetical protein